MSDQAQAKFEGWAVVEVFGHQRYAGFVTTEAFGQAVLFRVDVPPLEARERIARYYETDETGATVPPGSTVQEAPVQGYTKYLGPASIFAMTPCDQAAAVKTVAATQVRKVSIVRLAEERALPPAAPIIDASADDAADDEL